MTLSAMNRLNALWQQGRDFLGTEYAILGGAMSWVSERNLVSTLSNVGGFGVIACGAMTPELLDTEIKATLKLTNKPFGVNLITMHPQLEELVEVCVENKMTHVVLAGGAPPSASIKQIKNANIKLICFAPTLGFAKRLVRLGTDALVIEGMEAGGHIGPVSTSVLAQEILPHIKDVPVFVAGGIGTGESIISYLEMGAAGCQLGTPFVCATESIAHPNFKKAFIRANARDAQTTVQMDKRFPVIPVRALANEGTNRFNEKQLEVIGRYTQDELTLKEAQLEIERFWAGALRRAVIDGDTENGSLMAGQSVGLVREERPMQVIFDDLIGQSVQALERRHGDVVRQVA